MAKNQVTRKPISVYKVLSILTACCIFFGITRFLADNLALLTPCTILVFFIGLLVFPQLHASSTGNLRVVRGCCLYPFLLMIACMIYFALVIQLSLSIHPD